MKRRGLAQIPIMIALLLMAVAVPVATKLVQDSQENRGQATGSGTCYYGISECSVLKKVSGTCTPACTGIGKCCKDTVDRCDKGDRYCDGTSAVFVCKADLSGYDRKDCAKDTKCNKSTNKCEKSTGLISTAIKITTAPKIPTPGLGKICSNCIPIAALGGVTLNTDCRSLGFNPVAKGTENTCKPGINLCCGDKISVTPIPTPINTCLPSQGGTKRCQEDAEQNCTCGSQGCHWIKTGYSCQTNPNSKLEELIKQNVGGICNKIPSERKAECIKECMPILSKIAPGYVYDSVCTDVCTTLVKNINAKEAYYCPKITPSKCICVDEKWSGTQSACGIAYGKACTLTPTPTIKSGGGGGSDPTGIAWKCTLKESEYKGKKSGETWIRFDNEATAICVCAAGKYYKDAQYYYCGDGPKPQNKCTQCTKLSNGKKTGDADCSGKTQLNDASIWREEFLLGKLGTDTKNSWKADFDCDGKVTINDVSIWRSNFIKGL